MAAAHVGGRGVGGDGLQRTGNRGGGDVGGTEVVHGGGVGPLGRDGGVRVVRALVGAGHGEYSGGVRVVEPGLGHVGGGDGGGAEEETAGGANAARVDADARRELLKVVDGVEHFSASTWGREGREQGDGYRVSSDWLCEWLDRTRLCRANGPRAHVPSARQMTHRWRRIEVLSSGPLL